MAIKLQMAPETTPGTFVPATGVLDGEGRLSDGRQLERRAANTGRYGPRMMSRRVGRGGSISPYASDASFEEIETVLSAAVSEPVNRPQDGSGYVREYIMPLAENLPIQTYSAEYVTDSFSLKAAHCYVTSFQITGRVGEPLKLSATWSTGIVTRLNDADISSANIFGGNEDILFDCGQLWIDDTGATIGSTEWSNKHMSFDLTVNTGNRAVETQDCDRRLGRMVRDEKKISATLKLMIDNEDDTGATARDESEEIKIKQFKLAFYGSKLTTAGTRTTKAFEIEGAGVFQDVTPDEDQGAGVAEIMIDCGDSVADDRFLGFRVVNELAEVQI